MQVIHFQKDIYSYRKRASKQKSTGFLRFTLLELLIVIAIISILASLLLPALKHARENSKGIACLGNLKTIGIAQMCYSNDYDNWIVLRQLNGRGWYLLLSGAYTNSSQANYGVSYIPGVTTGTFACPSEEVEWGCYLNAPSEFNHTHYGVNGYVAGYHEETLKQPCRKINAIIKPSVAVFGTDTNHRAGTHIHWINLPAYRHGASDPRPADTSDYADCCAPYPLTSYKGRTHVLYFDGHVQARSITELRNQPDEDGNTSTTSFAKAGIKL